MTPLTLLDAKTTRELIYTLQKIAHDSGHQHPLLIAIDQENGMLNNLIDSTYISQFPGNMAIVATKSKELATQVAEAMGKELKMLGVNWVLGPVVDVLTSSTNRLLGVRTMGDDPQEVTDFAVAFLEGFKKANIVSCGKHFPGYGNATVDSTLGLPIVPDSVEQLETAALVPFRKIINNNVDAVMVGGCALPKVTMNEMHACLSQEVVQGLLREKLNYNGVTVSECLEMKTLYENVGVRQGAVMAASAGCDVIIVCTSYKLQLEAVSGIFRAVRDNILDESAVYAARDRILALKQKYLSWGMALHPASLERLKEVKTSHENLAASAYQRSITVLRDNSHYIPLSRSVEVDSDILLLTPLVAATNPNTPAEEVFKSFGRSLARLHTSKVMHSTYSSAGYRSALLERAAAVIIVTTDAARNIYQTEFTKRVGRLCNQHQKPMIAVAAASPYDLALDREVGTYVCSYEFTPESMEVVAKVLFGRLPAVGRFPGSGLYQAGGGGDHSRQRWLVEKWNFHRDARQLKSLWEGCFPYRRFGMQFDVFAQIFDNNGHIGKDQTHFIVRNSSTGVLYGFCATWIEGAIGSVMALLVSPSRRGMSIGRSLHERAIKHLRQVAGCKQLRLGSVVPSVFEGIPLAADYRNDANVDLVAWFRSAGWDIPVPGTKAKAIYIHTLVLPRLLVWSPSQRVISASKDIVLQVCSLETVPLLMASLGADDPVRAVYREALQSATVVVAVEPFSGRIVGSLVVFTRESTVKGYMPWILEFVDARVGGMCGLVVAADQGPQVKQGLVQYGALLLQQQEIEQCAVSGIKDRDVESLKQIGFEELRCFLATENYFGSGGINRMSVSLASGMTSGSATSMEMTSSSASSGSTSGGTSINTAFKMESL